MRRIFVFRHPRARGQAPLEFALVLPLILMMVIGIMMLFTEYQKELVYTKASQTLVEWIARTGRYDDAKRIVIQGQLSANPLVGASGTFLHVIVTPKTDPTDPNGVAIAAQPPLWNIGLPPLTTNCGTSNTGWNDTTTIINVPTGSAVAVEICYQFKVPFLPTIGTMVPASHSVFHALRGKS